MTGKHSGRTRPAAVAGGFYPADADELSREVKSYLKPGESAPGGTVGLLVPHAGYVYSGLTAGVGFAAVRDMFFDTVVILGTGHHSAVYGAALYGHGAFSTPLGDVEIDAELSDEILRSSPLFEELPSAHAQEHAIEVQLPFLQIASGKKFKLVPLLFNMAGRPELESMGRALGRALKGKKVLLVISSDLSHYPPADVAQKSDMSFLYALGVAMRCGDPGYLLKTEQKLMDMELPGMDTVCCGHAALVAGAYAALELGAGDFRLLHYSNSGYFGGADTARTVGYGAGLFCRGEGELFPLADAEKTALLRLARESIKRALDLRDPLEPALGEYPAFNVPAAAFVTLQMDGKLRGCIGGLEARQSLAEAVARLAVESAFEDSRFQPLEAGELEKVKIEISVLSPLVKADAKDIVPGKHGVVVQSGWRSGTYLPQVWEHFGTKEEFLSSLCSEKAGIPADAWKKKGTELYTYTATVISE
jgi:hypothetical protein